MSGSRDQHAGAAGDSQQQNIGWSQAQPVIRQEKSEGAPRALQGLHPHANAQGRWRQSVLDIARMRGKYECIWACSCVSFGSTQNAYDYQCGKKESREREREREKREREIKENFSLPLCMELSNQINEDAI